MSITRNSLRHGTLPAMRLFVAWAVLAGWATVARAGQADCARIAEREARLDCYDSFAPPPADKAPSAPSSAAPRPPARAAAPAVKNDDPDAFGLTPAQRALSSGPARISARITNISSAPASHSKVVLDNGQIWTVLDDDGGLSAGDAISIKRAMLGTFLMIAPSNHTYRVRRLQ